MGFVVYKVVLRKVPVRLLMLHLSVITPSGPSTILTQPQFPSPKDDIVELGSSVITVTRLFAGRGGEKLLDTHQRRRVIYFPKRPYWLQDKHILPFQDQPGSYPGREVGRD